jgi:hypothetical protein
MHDGLEIRRATCRCGQLAIDCAGEPIRISVCHCLDCQRRSGSAFAAQARFPEAAVTVTGAWRTWIAVRDSGRSAEFCFCNTCGSTLFYRNEALPGQVAVAVGAFADPTFPAPWFSIYENRKHAWVEITGDVEHD